MPASILEVVSVGKNQGEALLNRWHFVSADGSGTTPTVFPAFVTNVLGPYAAMANTQVVWTELLWRIITDPLAPQQIYAITPSLHGTDGALPAPTFVCGTIRWAIGTSVVLTAETPQRRVRRGGKHLGGLVDNFVVGNAIDPTQIHFIEAVAQGYLGMADGGFIPCVCGFPKQTKHVPGTPPRPTPPPNKYALITGYSVNVNAGSEVSRKVGHGA
jgi:hypothetical protein